MRYAQLKRNHKYVTGDKATRICRDLDVILDSDNEKHTELARKLDTTINDIIVSRGMWPTLSGSPRESENWTSTWRYAFGMRKILHAEVHLRASRYWESC